MSNQTSIAEIVDAINQLREDICLLGNAVNSLSNDVYKTPQPDETSPQNVKSLFHTSYNGRMLVEPRQYDTFYMADVIKDKVIAGEWYATHDQQALFSKGLVFESEQAAQNYLTMLSTRHELEDIAHSLWIKWGTPLNTDNLNDKVNILDFVFEPRIHSNPHSMRIVRKESAYMYKYTSSTVVFPPVDEQRILDAIFHISNDDLALAIYGV